MPSSALSGALAAKVINSDKQMVLGGGLLTFN